MPGNYKNNLPVVRARLSAISKIAEAGAGAIDRGDYALVQGRAGSQALLKRLNTSARNRQKILATNRDDQG
jgi:hypothetical protein